MLTDEEACLAFHANRTETQHGVERLEMGLRAVIAANNAKALADLKPAVTEDECTDVCVPGGGKISVSYYSADQVAPLIQRNEALEARVKELEVKELEAQVKSLTELLDIHAPDRP